MRGEGWALSPRTPGLGPHSLTHSLTRTLTLVVPVYQPCTTCMFKRAGSGGKWERTGAAKEIGNYRTKLLFEERGGTSRGGSRRVGASRGGALFALCSVLEFGYLSFTACSDLFANRRTDRIVRSFASVASVASVMQVRVRTTK